MKITFIPLTESHFPLLLEWLEVPHVKAWWDQNIKWTLALIQEKYSDYVKGYKLDNGIAKPMKAYIICIAEKPIGYVQIYNAYDFPRSKPLSGLPKNLGAFDIFIGEEKYLGQNIGSKAITKFFNLYAHQYSHIFVDPDTGNLAAIKCYEKAGFRRLLEQKDSSEVWMLYENKENNLKRLDKLPHGKNANTKIVYLSGKPGVGKYTIAKVLANKHGFIICDNQLINNPIFELLQYDGYTKIPDFAWDSIARIRTEIFDFLTKVSENSYVLTNNLYEDDGERNLYEQVKKMAELRDSIFVPVRLLINEQEHLKRVVQPERRARWKSIDPQDVYEDRPLLSISHPHLLELDVNNLSAEEAANKIANHIKSLKS